MTDFNAFGLPETLMAALDSVGFTTPTPIQAQAIPHALEGRDILGSAATGTGKTAAFGLPLLTHLIRSPQSMALVMTPTRELATQVLSTLQPFLAAHRGVGTACLIGGDSMNKQLAQLARKPRLIVGTPGRINDHLQRRSLKLGQADILVLDETDRMLDMGFGSQIETIIPQMAAKRQTLLFSATLPRQILKMAAKYQQDPVRVSIGDSNKPATNIKQTLIRTADADKYTHLTHELDGREGSVIVFVKTKRGADRLATRLSKAGYATDAIHGDLQQSRRDRVIRNFRASNFRILVATDVAARGLDIPHIEHVINHDLPQNPEDFIHRIGRTARAGAEGEAVTFLSPSEADKWYAIQRLIAPEETRGEARPQSGKPRGARFKGQDGKWRQRGPRDDRGPNRNDTRSDERPRDRYNERDGNRGTKPAESGKRYAPRPAGEERPYHRQASGDTRYRQEGENRYYQNDKGQFRKEGEKRFRDDDRHPARNTRDGGKGDSAHPYRKTARHDDRVSFGSEEPAFMRQGEAAPQKPFRKKPQDVARIPTSAEPGFSRRDGENRRHFRKDGSEQSQFSKSAPARYEGKKVKDTGYAAPEGKAKKQGTKKKKPFKFKAHDRKSGQKNAA